MPELEAVGLHSANEPHVDVVLDGEPLVDRVDACAADDLINVVLTIAHIWSQHRLCQLALYPANVKADAVYGLVFRMSVQVDPEKRLVIACSAYLFNDLLKRPQLHVLLRVVLVAPQGVHLHRLCAVGSHLREQAVPDVGPVRLLLLGLRLFDDLG